MKWLWRRLGTLTFWLLWPALIVYLNRSERARVLIVFGDEVLVLKSWLGINKWALAGGGLHRGEAPIDAVRREVQEEIGVVLEKQSLQYLFSAPYSYHGFRYPCHYFATKFDRRPAVELQAFEVVDYAWMNRWELTAKNSRPDTLAAVAAWFDS